MADCIWYVSGFYRPWEAAVIGSLAAALKAKGVPLQVYVEGGTGDLRTDDVLSWRSLTFFERMAVVLFRGKLWHLWGKAPCWWNIVRFRARTVHTTLDASPEWRGHPTRLFAEQVREGENMVRPTFEVKVAWAGESAEENQSALLLAVEPNGSLLAALDRFGMATIRLTDTGPVLNSSLRKGKFLVVDDSPTSALLAAYLSMQGLPVVARKSSPTENLLGKNGCIVVEEDSEEAWLRALETAQSDEGRTIAAGARRFLKENFTASDSAETLIDLYRSVTRGKD